MDTRPGALDERLWGADPSASEFAAAQRDLQQEGECRLASTLAGSITIAEAAARTHTSFETVTAAVDDGDLATIAGREDQVLVPAWQLDTTPGTARCALAGVADIARLFPSGTPDLTTWAVTPCADLGGRSPAEALADGEVTAVLAVARTLTAAGW